MAVSIVHLSDLHFGGGFDLAQWRAVEKAINPLNPNLIIVSGDLVDHPLPEHLENAKRELETLAAKAGAQLYVVPGNHDLFYFGNDMRWGRVGWFDHVFNGAGRVAAGRTAAGDAMPTVAGFTRDARGARPLRAMFGYALSQVGIRGKFTPPPPPPQPQDGRAAPLTRQPTDIPVLLALLDSNAADQPIGLATGSVSSNDLVALDAELDAIKTPHLVRIAVIHHHLLPIAHTAGKIVGAEPFMVMHNAGDVLSVLARHRFDLVLHGHKHRAQFTRVDFSPASAEGYPIAVAAAGSAALHTGNDPRGNSFNVINVQDNGRIIVRSLHYGNGTAPHLDGVEGDTVRTYTETVESAKRRAFLRASERHRIFCDRREQSFEVTENGDLLISQRISGLRLLRSGEVYTRRPHNVRVPLHGRLVIDLRLDDQSCQHGYWIERGTADGGAVCRTMVVLPESLVVGRTAEYAVDHACANCMVMTPWEAEERTRENRAADVPPGGTSDDEWVGTFVSHPVEEFTINLKLANSLSSVKPYVRCKRLQTFPDYRTDETDDVEVTPEAAFEIDAEMETEERQQLRYQPSEGRWQLVIRKPMVGYRYELRWQTPGARPDEPIPSETQEYREQLLRLGERAAEGQATDGDAKAVNTFNVISAELEGLLGRGAPDEKRCVDLFVYNRSRFALRGVLSHRSWMRTLPRADFEIALGCGIAGAAFLQRRIVPWAESSSGPAFIAPVPYPNTATATEEVATLRTMLAIPVYHTAQQDDSRPSPWAAIGVVSFGSSSPASKIPALLNQNLSDASVETIRMVRALSQAGVHEMLRLLSHCGAP